jgi:hypothetical protein
MMLWNGNIMETPTRQKIFQMAARKLRQDFQELQNVPHAGERGGEAEKLIKTFLRNHIPRRFDVGSGFILDRKDNVSRQTDVIIFDALNCPTYRVSDSAAIYPSNNVAAVVEVKSRLDSRELEDALTKIASVKSLTKTLSPEGSTLAVNQTHGSIFAFESAITLDTIQETYVKAIMKNGLGHHADLICVLDKGLITPVAKPRGGEWGIAFMEGLGGADGEGTHLGIATHQLGDLSLDAFLRLILANLTFFRNVVDHPGVGWGAHLPMGMIKIVYLTSISNDTDPIRRQQKMAEYAAEVREDFARRPVPPDWPR